MEEIVNAKRLLLAPFAIVLTLTVFQSNTHADIRAVALYGQLAPGFTSGHFSDFGEASVNASGDMAFYAWVDVGGFQNSGIFAVLGGVLTPIALQGQPLPDGSGRKFLAAFSAPKINDNGTIVFSAQFTPGTVTTNYRGIFEYSAGTLQGVFDESTPAFSGGHFGFEEAAPVLINNSGKIALRAYFGSLGASIGIFTLSQGVVQYVFSAAGPDDIQFALNNNGDMALGNALGLLTGAIARGISISSGGTITQIVTYGQAVPNSNLVVSGG